MPHRLALMGLLLAACDRTPEPAASPVPETMPTKSSTPAPAAAPDMFTSTDGQVAAPRPAGDGWDCVEQAADGATLIKCRRTDRSKFFFVMAKDYVVPADQVRTAEALATVVFPTTYQQLFTSHEIRESRAVDHAGEPAHEVSLDAVHASMGKIRKRERVIVQDDHVFVISAEGLPEAFDAEAATTEAWFAGARFARLR